MRSDNVVPFTKSRRGSGSGSGWDRRMAIVQAALGDLLASGTSYAILVPAAQYATYQLVFDTDVPDADIRSHLSGYVRAVGTVAAPRGPWSRAKQ